MILHIKRWTRTICVEKFGLAWRPVFGRNFWPRWRFLYFSKHSQNRHKCCKHEFLQHFCCKKMLHEISRFFDMLQSILLQTFWRENECCKSTCCKHFGELAMLQTQNRKKCCKKNNLWPLCHLFDLKFFMKSAFFSP